MSAGNKLYHFESDPTPKNWDKITAALDEQTTPHADRLFHFEEIPAADNWKKILGKLENDSKKSALVVPFFQRYSRPLKYVSAAAVLVILATIITLFINKDGVANELATQQGSQPANIQPKDEKTNNTIENSGNNNISNTDLPNPKNDQTASHPKNPNLKNGVAFASNRYVTIADDEGKKVRVSKKAYNVLNCAENRAAINNARCKENIEAMQQKMSASLLSSSGDFAGLIDMIKSLEENK